MPELTAMSEVYSFQSIQNYLYKNAMDSVFFVVQGKLDFEPIQKPDHLTQLKTEGQWIVAIKVWKLMVEERKAFHYFSGTMNYKGRIGSNCNHFNVIKTVCQYEGKLKPVVNYIVHPLHIWCMNATWEVQGLEMR